MDNYSSAMLKTFAECPQKYFFKYVKGISVPQSAKIFEKGKRIHALASFYLKGEDTEKFEKVLTEDEKQTWQTLLAMPLFKLKPYKVEHVISVKVDEYWFNGRLDAIVRKDNDFIILDYKTGSIPKSPENDFQTMIYLLAADKLLKNHTSLKFVYLDLRHNKQAEITLTHELKSRYEHDLTEICDKIEQAKALKIYPQTCTNCEYGKLCNNC